MGKKAPKKAYVVTIGRNPGIYRTWEECKKQVDGFSGQRQRGFETVKEAEDYWEKHLQESKSSLGDGRNLKIEPLISRHQNLQVEQLSRKRARPAADPTESDQDEEPASKKRRIHTAGPDEAHNTDEDEKVSLTLEQQVVYEAAFKKQNIFLTGAAGSGKTVTLKAILAGFRKRGINYQVIAPTGLAALPLGGKTLHSFLGWKPDVFGLPLEELLKLPSKSVKKNVKRIRVLVVEEVSMLENQTLERMNLVMQSIMSDNRPFGGIQVFFLGDFYQLPPVKPFHYCIKCGRLMSSKDLEYRCPDCPAGNAEVVFHEEDKWAFKANVWQDLNLRYIRLKQLHRQKDPRFQDILNKIRNGLPLSEDEWQDLERKKPLPPGICAVRLMSLRRQVDALNERELSTIQSPEKSWEAVDSHRRLEGNWNGTWDSPWEIDNPLENHSFPSCLSLKVGAKVVLLANLDPEAQLVNGTQGEVIGFEEVPDVEPGPTESTPPIQPVGDKIRSRFEPIVRFANGAKKTISPVERSSRCGTNQRPYLASRTQIPLLLAWGLSIHKSQGMTLQYLEVSSKDLFEPGQLYVGLSRATSLESLTLSGGSRKQLCTDAEVLKFYENTKWETTSVTREENCLDETTRGQFEGDVASHNSKNSPEDNL